MTITRPLTLNGELTWTTMSATHEDALLGDFEGGDGVSFSLSHMPTCYRRGPYRLLVEVAYHCHHLWGCFDDQDQPMRWYHHLENAKSEAQAIADVLLSDRKKMETVA